MPDLGRCRVMGIVNVTPDSFSDGGLHLDPDAAVKHGLQLLADGADIVDVGGESTRPGAHRIDAAEEIRRVEPVVRGLAEAGAVVSIDTMRRETAERALAAGARMVNDVSGGRADADLPRLVADAGVPYVVMHWRGHSDEMQQHAEYADVVSDVIAELQARVEAVTDAGVAADQIVLDPGLGFAKWPEHNWALLAHLDRLLGIGRPLLLGASRKSFLGSLFAAGDGEPRAMSGRDDATAAITAVAAAAGAWAVRVHVVAPSADAVRVVAAIRDKDADAQR
ncbi:MAG TPA: dihydropteroate synthase [Mycobacteriales bacterium]|nr:dihydropteroate synthase [Mycobacteriales bacterium]